MLTDKATIVELAQSMGRSHLLRQLEIVLAGAGQQDALARIYEEIGAPSEEADDLSCIDPYHAAAMRGDAEMIRWLAANGAKPLLATIRQLPARGERSNYCESLHLILATMRDDECAKAMLEAKFVDPKWPVAEEAAVYRSTDSTGPEYLLADARNTKVDQKGWKKAVHKPVPITFAMVNDLPKTTEYLLALGVEPTSRTFTAMLAARALDRAVAFLEGHPGYADGLLIASVSAGDLEATRQALRLGGDPNLMVRIRPAKDPAYRQPLLLSCENTEQMRLLVQAGADPNAVDEHGVSMLVKMIRQPKVFNEQHVRELVDMGADVAQGHKGRSIMQVAVGRAEPFKRMLRALRSANRISEALSEPELSPAPAAPPVAPGLL